MDEIRKAVEKLNASELYLDDNSPWRLMLTRRDGWHQAIAEQYDEERGAHGDGQWGDGKAICEIVNAAIKLVAAAKGGERVGEAPKTDREIYAWSRALAQD